MHPSETTSMNYRALWAVLAGGLLISVCTATTAGEVEKGFEPLFNGKDMTAFELIQAPAKTWSVEQGIIKCTGKPNGYFATKKSYKNYILRLDFRFPVKPGNSGYLLNITGKHKIWPKCIEVQGHYNSVGTIFPAGGAKRATSQSR